MLQVMLMEQLYLLMEEEQYGELFVVDEIGRLKGTITLADLSEAAFDHGFDHLVNAGDVARVHPPFLTLLDNLEHALLLMGETGEEHIAIVDSGETMKYQGCIHQRDLMAAYNRALVESRHEERGEAI